VPFGPWAALAWPTFSDHVIAEFGPNGDASVGLSRRDP
jgi:hypothetical protein